MSKKFPHLNDTEFPNENTVNPYGQYENAIDYDAYSGKQHIKPCSVRWNVDSTDRVKWNSDKERDKWFDGLKGDVFDFESEINIVPETTVKIPVPYYAFQNCNYLMVIQPRLPNDDTQFDYGNSGVSRYFYFVISAHSVAPSTTEITVQLDYWTTFINHAEIPRIALERGHYPTTLTTVADYLHDPITRSTGLTEPEPFGLSSPAKIANTEYVPIMAGSPYMLFAVACNLGQFESIMQEVATDTSSAASYSDGVHPQYDVSGFVWGGLPKVDSLNLPVKTAQSADNTVPNGYFIFAIETSEIYKTDSDFFTVMSNSYPQIYNLIYATYIVNDNCLKFGANFKIGDFTVYQVLPSENSVLHELDLTEDKFGYDEHYKMLAKLYTNPFANIILDDNNGNITEISIENVAESLHVCERVNVIYPYLNCNVFATNIGGKGVKSLKWIDLNGIEHEDKLALPDTGFSKILSDYEIPTFTLFVKTDAIFNLNSRSNAITQARNNAIAAYHVTNAAADTALVTAQRSINASQTNANRSAATAKNNTIRSNATAITNQTLSNNLNVTITNNSNTASTDVLNQSLVSQQTTFDASNTKIKELNTASLNLTQNLVNTEVTASAMSNVTATVGTLAGAATGIAVTAASGGTMAPIVGAALGAAGSVALSGVSYATGTSKTTDEATSKLAYNLSAMKSTLSYNEAAYNASTAQQRYANIKHTALNSDNTAATNTTNATIAKNNSDTSNSNATDSYNAAVANAQNNATTGNVNAATANGNSLFAAQQNMDIAQQNYEANLADLRRQRPMAMTASSGDPLPDMRHVRGLQIRIMTQPADVVRRVGDEFLRYGYRYSVNVDSPVFCLKRFFTFWQGAPTVFGAIPYAAISEITALFENGITIWSNPDKIGVSIYENEKE